MRPLIRFFAQFGFNAVLNEAVGVNWSRTRGPSTCWFKFTKNYSARLRQMTPLAVSWNLCHLIFFTIYLSSNLGSGLGTRLSFKVLILTEKNFYIPFFLFSHQAGQCTAKPGSNAVKVSNGGHLWKIQRLKCFKGRRIQFVTRRFAYLDGMSLRKRLIIWSDHIWFTKADFSEYSLVCLGGNHLVNSSRCQGSLYRRPVLMLLDLKELIQFHSTCL